MNVYLAKAALATIRQEALRSEDGAETGGILLGYEFAGDIAVIEAVWSWAAAVRRPTFFLRDIENARKLADAGWERDGLVWVGDWHTHPAGGAVPSATDMATYNALLSDDELAFESFLTFIVTARGGSWDVPVMGCWSIDCDGQQGVELL